MRLPELHLALQDLHGSWLHNCGQFQRDLWLQALIVPTTYRRLLRCLQYLQTCDPHQLYSELTLNQPQKMSKFVLSNPRAKMCADFQHEHHDKQSAHSSKSILQNRS